MEHRYKKYTLVAIVLVLMLLSILIIFPYITAIITSVILAIVFYPVYAWIAKIVRYKPLASFLACLAIILLVVIPTVLIVYSLFGEIALLLGYLQSGQIDGAAILAWLQHFQAQMPILSHLNLDLSTFAQNGFTFLLEFIKSQISSLPSTIISLFLMLLLLYYLFMDGPKIVDYIFELVPVSAREREILLRRSNEITYAVAYGQIVTALIQGGVATIGYYFLGLKAPLLWGLITAVFAMVPYIGAGTIWFPASVYLFAVGWQTHEWWKGIALFLYGALVVSTIDNLIKPKLIGERGNVHPGVVLLGVVGGLELFGIIGIFAGPLILAVFIQVIDLIAKID